MTAACQNTPSTHPDNEGLLLATRMIACIATEINEKIRRSENTQALLEDARGRDTLALYVGPERAVLASALDVPIKIGAHGGVVCVLLLGRSRRGPDGIKAMLGKLKADVYLLSDALLLVLRRTAKLEGHPYLEDITHLFWPTRVRH